MGRPTSMMPRVLSARLDETGLDCRSVYPTAGLRLPRIKDDETRRAVIRAYNIVSAEYFDGLGDRMTPAAIIPMHHPEEAIAELEFSTKQLGSKVGMFGSGMARPIAEPAGNERVAYDVLAIDSPYDYDPVWAKCAELAIAPTFHSTASGQGLRNAPSNFVYNHIGHFAAAGHAVAKGLFLGGVTRRFPRLKFAFLEGGVAWGCSLLADLVAHWEKRNGVAIRDLDPAMFDRARLMELFKQYGDEKMTSRFAEFDQMMIKGGMGRNPPEEIDDFAAAKITRKSDLRDLFVPNFFFGCEPDDPTTTYAFAKANPFGAKLGAILSSDISHFDVPDMTEVLEEAWELVEEKGMSEEDFHAFSFGNAVRLWASLNRDFFKGTVVEREARQYFEQNPPAAQAAAAS